MDDNYDDKNNDNDDNDNNVDNDDNDDDEDGDYYGNYFALATVILGKKLLWGKTRSTTC